MVWPKIGIILSGFSVVALAQIDGILKTGNNFGHLGALGIMGVVCIASIIALVQLYKDRSADQHKLIEMIEESTKASTQSAEAIKANTGVMVEMKDAIIRCKHNNRP
uniref:Uncharacterized protein n=1 Tax=viral metagenome TaxID=1070528 RepID=A0A6M3JGM7_9ZZZZ